MAWAGWEAGWIACVGEGVREMERWVDKGSVVLHQVARRGTICRMAATVDQGQGHRCHRVCFVIHVALCWVYHAGLWLIWSGGEICPWRVCLSHCRGVGDKLAWQRWGGGQPHLVMSL